MNTKTTRTVQVDEDGNLVVPIKLNISAGDVDAYSKGEVDNLLDGVQSVTDDLQQNKVNKQGEDDITILDAFKGLILKSPNGTLWRFSVGDDGALSTNEVY